MLDLKGLPDFSKINQAPAPAAPTPAEPVAPAPTTPAAPAAGGLNAFMPGGKGDAANKSPAPQGGYSSTFSSVKKLQEAIINFANKASDTDLTSMKGNNNQQTGNQQYETPNPNFDDLKPESPENPKTIKNNEYLGGSDAFGKFLVNNYLGPSDPIGHQYLNVDVSGQKNREGASIEDTSMRGIIDSIKRVGAPGSEKGVDGVWKERTNNAIKNIFALTYAIYQAAKAMNLTLPNLNDSILEEFKKLVPQKYTDVPPNEVADRADKLTDMIQSMTMVFKGFKDFVLKNKQYSQYINQTKPFAQYKQRQEPKNGTDVLTKDEQALASSYKTPFVVPFKGRRGALNTNVFLSDLENMETVSALMKRIGRDPNNADQVKSTLNEVLHAIPEYTAG